MNIKNLRKNYQRLSKRERFILYDSAENRNDKSEMEAVLKASPKQDWILYDLAFQMEKIFALRMIRIIQRLKHSRDALFWLSIDSEQERTFNLARFSAYGYCVIKDSTETVFKELGLDNEAWQGKEEELFHLNITDHFIDDLLRKIAFEKTEVEEYFKDLLELGETGTTVIDFTFENECESLRKLIKKSPLKDIWEN